MFRHLFSVISLLFIIISPCMGDIASVSHVNTMRDNVQAKIDNKAQNDNYTPNMVLQTDGSGNVIATTVGTDLLADGSIQTMHLADGAVTNADLAGMIDITKLNLGTLPTSGKHIMIWNATTNEYVFEKYADSASSGLQCDAGTYDIGFDQCVDPATIGTNSGYDQTEWTWWADFDYGRVTGEATCLSAAEGLGRTSGQGAYYGTGEYASTFIDTVKGLKDKDADGNERRYCWCKMLHPAVSRWVFGDDYSSASSCASYCAYYCGIYVQYDAAMRPGVFGSVGLK